MFLDRLAQTAEEKCGLKTDLPILVGVSGGVDSLALMLGLRALGYQQIISHLDHGLRAESSQDAKFVQELAEHYGFHFVGERIDVQNEVDRTGQSVEEVARNIRYQFLFQQARIFDAQAVAVGHHADDQIETVLMHFLRGAALPGLSGMPYRGIIPLWDGQIPLVRPLLDLWRDEIDAYVAELGISPRIDLSNQDTTYFRNRLRHELIPQLETYNPQFRNVILRMVAVLNQEDQLLQTYAQQAWEDCFQAGTKERVELSASAFNDLPTAIQRRVLRRSVAQLCPNLRDVGFQAIERGLAFAVNPSESGQMDLVAHLNMAIVGDTLIIKTWDADLPDWDKPLLPTEQSSGILDRDHPFALQHGWHLELGQVIAPVHEIMSRVRDIPTTEALLDADLLDFPLTVRSRRMGERWRPFGLGGHSQLITDFFINEKIPEHWRKRWPLVCSGDEVAWVVGTRPSESFKITDRTQEIIRLKLIRNV